jgi:hypothetical protein
MVSAVAIFIRVYINRYLFDCINVLNLVLVLLLNAAFQFFCTKSAQMAAVVDSLCHTSICILCISGTIPRDTSSILNPEFLTGRNFNV